MRSYDVNRIQQGPKEESVGKMKEQDIPKLMETLRSLRDEIISCKEDNENIIRE